MAAQPSRYDADNASDLDEESFCRVPVEAMDDIEWYCTEACSEMGEESCQGALLQQASLDYEWCRPDMRDLELKREGLSDGRGHFGASYGAQPWREWIADSSYANPRALEERKRTGGYYREIWGARPAQTQSSRSGNISQRQADGTLMCDNVEAVLALMPQRLRVVTLTQHQPCDHGATMRRAFGKYVRIAALSQTAREAFGYARAEAKRGHGAVPEKTLYAWLESLALRKEQSRSKKGEQAVLESASKEMFRELTNGYFAYEEARARLPEDLAYPWQQKALSASRLAAARRM